MSSVHLKLDWCGAKAARYACRFWHYSGTEPVGKRANVGVWENEMFIGVVIFTLGSGASADGRRFGLARRLEVAELQRVALNDHATPVSRIISIAVKMVRKQSPGLKLLISFADPSQGHHGGIYQACGWVYIGVTSRGTEYHSPDGRIFHPRVVSPTGYKVQFGELKKTKVPFNVLTKVNTPGKHIYLFPLEPGVRLMAEARSKPYPKRPKDYSEPPVHHTGEGGAAPTRTLQTSR